MRVYQLHGGEPLYTTRDNADHLPAEFRIDISGISTAVAITFVQDSRRVCIAGAAVQVTPCLASVRKCERAFAEVTAVFFKPPRGHGQRWDYKFLITLLSYA